MEDELAISRCDLDKWELLSKLSKEEKEVVKEIFVYYVHNCGYGALYITSNDEVYGIGWNGVQTNLLGFTNELQSVQRVDTPCKVHALSTKAIRSICVDEYVGTALDETGVAYWWGNFNEMDGDDLPPDPIQLPEPIPTDMKFKQVSSGVQIIAGLSIDGNVYVWGRVFCSWQSHNERQLVVNHPVISISCGGHHVVMIADNGTVYTWGDGNSGQRGYGCYLESDQLVVKPLQLNNIVAIRCGNWCSYFLSTKGEVWACGENHLSSGYLGINQDRVIPQPSRTEEDDDDDCFEIKTPVKVSVPQPVTALAVSWESDMTLGAALSSSGLVYAWGRTSEVEEISRSSNLIEAFIGKATPHDVGLVKVN